MPGDLRLDRTGGDQRFGEVRYSLGPSLRAAGNVCVIFDLAVNKPFDGFLAEFRLDGELHGYACECLLGNRG